ncbi:hypothetical protein BHECKSOX_2224 [Bathymodiolus heckerae thiotrophic gill symbiont]|uniref:DUF2335 domain-containing protein n=1 Tax=Bathymodiolus heckerae thiotrophic gill symbiont TaxID=1052212 RepID=UPI0010B8E293|nr:DUF2335 domain-containing protein [Bathymodiolus heckerae thiotrophic gill symbiont]SHN91803.1 hypothetical protein BHECKSOX_2224 [Bathymodiolus heckerae thiotrophic gill symbiont]
MVAHQSKHYSGPIPQPSDLQKYEDIKVGFAERILAMAERESTHRQNLDNRIITSERAFNILGQMTALSIGVLVIALMGYAISQGFAEQVQWIGVSIASVVGLFIYKRK